MKSPELSIILVNYNGWDWLEKCLVSFSNLKGFDSSSSTIETIVVDNGSTDGSADKIAKVFPWVHLIVLPNNLGFSGGNNVGLQRAKGLSLMLLNTDTEFRPGTDLLSLIRNFDDKKVGIVTPKLVLDSGEIDHACHRGFPTPLNAFSYFFGLSRAFPKSKFFGGYMQSWKDLGTKHTVDACSGGALIIRRETLEDVGLLDESYFMYGEDLDWCYRLFLKGWKIIYDPSQVINHHKHKSGMGNKTSWETKERSISAFYDTMKQFYRKFYSDRYPSLVMMAIFWIVDRMKSHKLAQERKHYASL